MGTRLADTSTVEGRLTAQPRARGADDAGSTRARERLSRLLKKRTVTRAISFLVDAAAIVIAHITAKSLAIWLFHVPAEALSPPNYVAFYLPFLIAVLFLIERNQRPELRRPEKEVEFAVKGVSFGFALLVCANFVVFKTGFSRYAMVLWYVFTLLMLLAARYGLRHSYAALWNRGIARRKTLLIGSAKKLFELQTLLTIQRYRGYQLIGIVPVGTNGAATLNGDAHPVLGSVERWHETTQEFGAEQLIVALDESTPEAHELVFDILKHCLADGVDVQVYSDLFASRGFNYELDEFSGFFRFFATPRWSTRAQQIAKSALDIAGGVVGSVIVLAALPFVALAIKLDDGGPIFYRRELLGPGGHPRVYRKFRTMRTDAEQMLERDPALKSRFEKKHKLVDDPRVTRVGRFLRKYSIDELPEFFTVLTGKLALVGPRAITRKESARYGECLQKLTSVKPGMTGFWQVMGRQLTTYEERVHMDMFYIDHWSIWLDLWIVARTFIKVIKAEGAY